MGDPTIAEVVDRCARQFADAVEVGDWDRAERLLHAARIAIRAVVRRLIDPRRRKGTGL
jgi:hypothetical protein